MAELKIEIPDDLKKEMNDIRSVNWGEFLRKAIELKAFESELERSKRLKLLLLKAITSKSRLSEEEADKFAVELGREMKKGRFEQLKKMGFV